MVVSQHVDELSKLVRRARAGDQEAYGALVERSWADLVRLARGITTIDREAEDVVQEAFVHAWTRLWMLRRPSRFDAWMRRIVVRRALSRARRLRTMEEFVDLPQAAAEPGVGYDVSRLLACLAPRQRASLYLTWIHGYTDQEVGSLLGIRAATVRVHRHRGMRQLRRIIEGEGQ